MILRNLVSKNTIILPNFLIEKKLKLIRTKSLLCVELKYFMLNFIQFRDPTSESAKVLVFLEMFSKLQF